MTKYLMKLLFYFNLIFVEIFYFCFTFLTHFERKSYFLFINIIIAFIITTISLMQVFSVIWFGFTLWYGWTLYLKLKFNEIYNKITFIITKSNKYKNRLIINTIIEHNFCEILTKQLNHFFRCITFIIIYILIPACQIALYGIHHKDTTFYGRIFCSIIVITCFVAIILMNVMSTWISSSARKPIPILYSYLIKSKNKIPFNTRLKILSFIEHLSGPDIGFYCYDMFAMNSINYIK